MRHAAHDPRLERLLFDDGQSGVGLTLRRFTARTAKPAVRWKQGFGVVPEFHNHHGQESLEAVPPYRKIDFSTASNSLPRFLLKASSNARPSPSCSTSLWDGSGLGITATAPTSSNALRATRCVIPLRVKSATGMPPKSSAKSLAI